MHFTRELCLIYRYPRIQAPRFFLTSYLNCIHLRDSGSSAVQSSDDLKHTPRYIAVIVLLICAPMLVTVTLEQRRLNTSTQNFITSKRCQRAPRCKACGFTDRARPYFNDTQSSKGPTCERRPGKHFYFITRLRHGQLVIPKDT